MKAQDLNSIFKTSTSTLGSPEAEWGLLLTDSRKVVDAKESLFFAIPTKRNTGCKYVSDLYIKGTRNFVVPYELTADYRQQFEMLREANFWFVKDVVRALQQVVAYRREKFDIPVVGITGSNGKTIVKDWLVQMLSVDKRVVCSPKSYNSQIGVPLSVWQMSDTDEIGIFEAGVSEPGEMDHWRNVIKPTIGLFTNIGQAHDENFLTRQQKVAEKLQLFMHCEVLIYCTDHKAIHSVISEQENLKRLHRFTWGTSDEDSVRLQGVCVKGATTVMSIDYEGKDWEMMIPFIDRASVENAMQCVTLMLYLGYGMEEIIKRAAGLTPVAMRLEMKEGINNSLLINDSYSLDINSLTIALEYLQHEQQHFRKTLVMSDILQSGIPEEELYGQVVALLKQRGVSKFIGIGKDLCRNRRLFDGGGIECGFYETTKDFMLTYPLSDFQSEAILLKGARVFEFENSAKLLQRKSHETIMEVNLDAMIRNLNYYRSKINPSTKLMAMVKASSYGAGKVEVASVLQFNHVDYLTVAYSDEGVELRRNGITVPMMIMNPEEESFGDIIKYQLEPDIYSFRIFDAFSESVRLLGKQGEKIAVHIEFDTGMHRLGFLGSDINRLVEVLTDKDCVLEVKSIFSHLACADDPNSDDFTQSQLDRFMKWSSALKNGLGKQDICCHILNSSGIERFPDYQFDMVRLGIGLYGISPLPKVQAQLSPVSRLITKISQIKEIPQGDTVGYNGRWIAKRNSRIAIIPIGYADGLNRHLGYENGRVKINGQLAPIIGSICMDMCFIDVTDIKCKETDEVVIFGDADLLQQISQAAGTIPYEILTSVSPRVKRIYYQE